MKRKKTENGAIKECVEKKKRPRRIRKKKEKNVRRSSSKFLCAFVQSSVTTVGCPCLISIKLQLIEITVKVSVSFTILTLFYLSLLISYRQNTLVS
jgi:hypothetical protein